MKDFDWHGEREDGCNIDMSVMDMADQAFRVPPPLVVEEGVSDALLENAQTLVSPSGSSMDEADHDMDSDGEHMAVGLPSTTGVVDPEPHLSNQFYTFNQDSHHLMVQCILQSRYASPEEIRNATSPSVLASWRGVWKDRNEDTAYLTGWKRIQDKLHAHVDDHGNEVLCFKNNPQQYVPHINQWQDIAMSFHGDADLKHLGLKETIERIKQVWTVGAKFYGIPESFIRVCIASCSVCRSDIAVSQPRSKRRRFEYTESFEVSAKEVPQRLQQLAAKHKVVLCIRQKYIRYKPFMAEVKDYCCHRAGEPNTKKPGVLKRKRYSSKRCGCGFRIRAIVPIKDYNQKDKTFSYEEEGKAVFKLYAVHSGHEPGPHEGSARIIHRFVGPANSAIEQGTVYINEEGEAFAVIEKEADSRMAVMKQMEDLKMELGYLEGKIPNMSEDLLIPLSQDLCAITQRLKSVEEAARPQEMIMDKPHSDEVFVTDSGGLGDWCDSVHNKGKEEVGMNGGDDGAFQPRLENVSQSQRRRPGRPPKKKMPRDSNSIKSDKWIVSVKEPYSHFDSKSLLVCEDTKLCKTSDTDIRHDDTIVEDGNLVGMHVDGYYQDNIKWYEGMSCGLDPTGDCGESLHHTAQEGFRHAIV
eukprot:Gb_16375 [translate_table: standard]